VHDVTALVLAGGKATRMGGIAKHELVIGGRTIFERQRELLAPRVDEILVSGADVAGYRTVRDAAAGIGPLAGIAAGLAAVASSRSTSGRADGWMLVVAGDMPFLTAALLDRMLASRGDDLDAVGVRAGGLPEPLLCVLHARVREVVDRRIAAGHYKASGLFTDEGLRVVWVDEIDPRTVANINSQADLRE
jgi:molybdopterin-guanine dinucleotide biosynthesis protein A